MVPYAVFAHTQVTRRPLVWGIDCAVVASSEIAGTTTLERKSRGLAVDVSFLFDPAQLNINESVSKHSRKRAQAVQPFMGLR